MKRTICFVLVFLFILTGCQDIQPSDGSDGKYATYNAASPFEYSMFMNRELTTSASVILSRMSAVQSFTSSTNSSELASAQEGYSTIEECMNQIKITVPPKSYESQRETTLVILNTTLQHYKGYLTALQSNKNVSNYLKFFQNDYNEITSQATLYNQ